MTSVQHDELDDILLAIRPDSVSLFCPPNVWPLIERQVDLWPNLAVTTLNEEELMDTDMAEDKKVDCFIQMTATSKRVGVPIPGLAITEDIKGDSEFEKWPVVQAYAFEDMGNGESRGFFTMNHQVVR